MTACRGTLLAQVWETQKITDNECERLKTLRLTFLGIEIGCMAVGLGIAIPGMVRGFEAEDAIGKSDATQSILLGTIIIGTAGGLFGYLSNSYHKEYKDKCEGKEKGIPRPPLGWNYPFLHEKELRPNTISLGYEIRF